MKKKLVLACLLATLLATAPLPPPIGPAPTAARTAIHQQEGERDGDPDEFDLGSAKLPAPNGDSQNSDTSSHETVLKMILLVLREVLSRVLAWRLV